MSESFRPFRDITLRYLQTKSPTAEDIARLIEQARRANALVNALQISSRDLTKDELAALYTYLGEKYESGTGKSI